MTPTSCRISLEKTSDPNFFEKSRTWFYTNDLVVDLPTHMKAGKTFTASGYGFRIPTKFKVLFRSKWRRVYSCCYSNNETLFIGPSLEHGHIVELW